MSAARRPMESCVEFTFGGLLTFDELGAEAEVAPEHYRAWYFVFGDDSVCVTSIEHNHARPGRPAIWLTCQFPRCVTQQIKEVLERQFESEHDTPSNLSWEQIAADAAGKPRWGEL